MLKIIFTFDVIHTNSK